MLETVQSVRWLPLTPAQFDFWEEFSFHPHQPVSTVAHRITLRGELDEPALLAALEQVVAETDVFTIQFQLADNDELPLQRCNPQRRPRVRLIELQQTDVAESIMQADIERQLNLLSQPLAVVWLIRFSPSHYTVYIRAHHIINDTRSGAAAGLPTAKPVRSSANGLARWRRLAFYCSREQTSSAFLHLIKAAAGSETPSSTLILSLSVGIWLSFRPMARNGVCGCHSGRSG